MVSSFRFTGSLPQKIHREQFTTRAIDRRAIRLKGNSPQTFKKEGNSPQSKLTANNSPHSKFTANKSPQGFSPQRQFTAEAIHRRGNSP
jgi:hypothetical protein